MTRGIRGAVSVTENSRKAIFEATTRLLREILERNAIECCALRKSQCREP